MYSTAHQTSSQPGSKGQLPTSVLTWEDNGDPGNEVDIFTFLTQSVYVWLSYVVQSQGINAIFPVYKEGILNGGPDLKEQTAMLLGEVVALTTPEALKPALLNVTGPLIRIFGDRFNWNVKVAILDTLALLLKKVRGRSLFKTFMVSAVAL